MDGPLVSVCISTWNRCDLLETCINSVLKQDYQNIEIVVIDNASKDHTRDYLCKLDNVRFKILDKPEPNAMITLNMAFNAALGKYILVLDDDAYLVDNYAISSLVSDLENNPQAALVGANVMHYDGGKLISQMPIRMVSGEFLSQDEVNSLGTIKHYEFHGACALFRRNMVMEANPEGPYDNDFMIYINEFDLAGKMLNKGYEVLFDSMVLAMHVEKSATKCNVRHKYYIHNFNTCILRNFRGTFNRLKTVCIRTPMLFAFWYLRTGHLCSKFTIIQMFGFTCKELIRVIIRSFKPDVCHVYPDTYMQHYLEQSMYNSFKKYSLEFISKLIR